PAELRRHTIDSIADRWQASCASRCHYSPQPASKRKAYCFFRCTVRTRTSLGFFFFAGDFLSASLRSAGTDLTSVATTDFAFAVAFFLVAGPFDGEASSGSTGTSSA